MVTAPSVLAEPPEPYRLVSELISDLAYAFRVLPDGELELAWVAGALEEITGLSEGQLPCESWERLIHPEDVPAAMRQLEELLAGCPSTVEYRLVTASGEVRWMRDQAKPLKERPDGPVTFILGALQDITERRLATQALAESEEKYRQLVELCPDPVVIIQGDRFCFANPAFCEVFGYTREEAEQGVDAYAVVRDEDVALMKRRYRDRVGGKSVARTLRVDLLTRDGDAIPCETSAALVQFEGKPADLVMIRDLGERERATAEAERLERHLRQAHKMEAIGRLASGIAHDLNNILGTISGLASLLEVGTPGDDPRRQDLLSIQRAAQRGSTLTQNVLGFARPGSGRREVLEVAPLIGEVVRILRRTAPAGVTIEARLDDEVGRLNGDQDLLSQALMNLCLNAVEALGGKGEVRISARDAMLAGGELTAWPGLESGRYVEVTVEDDGRGMDAEVLERALEPFYSRRPSGDGTGLGLSIVYGTAREHDGALALDSEPGQGSRATLMLPAFGPAESPASDQAAGLPCGDGELVLVVDDDDVILLMVERMLEQLGYRALLATGGQEALDVFARSHEPIAAVLLDLAMPGMSGEVCLTRLRNLAPQLPVVICSGHAHSRGVALVRAHPRVGCLAKPFDLARLARAVADALTPPSAV